MVPAPPVRRRLVGRALRQYRERLGYTLEDAARLLECDRSKISRIETGQRGIRPKELGELLNDYRVPQEQQVLLVELADPRGAFGWYRDYADVLPGPQRDYLILEAAASRITAYEAQRVPGLLQTRPTRGPWPSPTRAWPTRSRVTGRSRRCWPASRRSWSSGAWRFTW